MNYPAVIPSKELLNKFNKLIGVVQTNILLKKQENQKLTEMKDLLLSKLASN
jgi:type I restriction enzyme S subunit